MNDKRRIESSIQVGRVRAEQWMAKYLQAENAEAIDKLMAELVANLPPGGHETLESIDPEMHRRVMERVQGGRNGR